MNSTILEEFGLTRNEIEIFIILVQKGTLSATTIAKETGLNRPYVYYALERLLEKGYITEIHVKGKKNFQSISLNQLTSLEEHKLGALKQFIQDIRASQSNREESIVVEVFKGKYTVKNIFKKILSEIKPNQEILYLGLDEEKMETIEPVYIKKLLNYFKSKKISERIIMKCGGKTLPYAITTKYKTLHEDLIGNAVKIIYHNTVIELLYGMPLYAVVIKNKMIADTARKQFEVFWELAT